MTRVKTLDDVEELEQQGRSVYCEATVKKVFPAAVMMSMSGVTILRLLRYGVFVYEPKKKLVPWTKVLDGRRKGDKVEGHKR